MATSSPRWVQVPRKYIKLCGGNAIGILAEAPAGDLQEGDLILQIDGYDVRGSTLEEATEALLESLSEIADLLIEDGGDRLNRLRLGADGDAVFVRVNVDRNSENKDELDIRAVRERTKSDRCLGGDCIRGQDNVYGTAGAMEGVEDGPRGSTGSAVYCLFSLFRERTG